MTEKELYKELTAGTANELLDRITTYPDQNALNYEASGQRKKHPVGFMAAAIREYNTPFTKKDSAFYAMARSFAKVVAGTRTAVTM